MTDLKKKSKNRKTYVIPDHMLGLLKKKKAVKICCFTILLLASQRILIMDNFPFPGSGILADLLAERIFLCILKYRPQGDFYFIDSSTITLYSRQNSIFLRQNLNSEMLSRNIGKTEQPLVFFEGDEDGDAMIGYVSVFS